MQNEMFDPTQRRGYILAASVIGINLAAVYTFLVPTAGNRQIAEFEFPSSFQAMQSATITMTASKTTENYPVQGHQAEIIKARRGYQDTRHGREIALTLNYIIGTRGDINTYLQNYTDIEPQVIKAQSVQTLAGIGHHALLTDNDRAYLTSCISPRSPSNVTQKQFSQYRYENDLTWQTGLSWLLGHESIRDRRCLWVLLSTPVTANEIKADYQALEATWQDIYQWWLPNFPLLIDK